MDSTELRHSLSEIQEQQKIIRDQLRLMSPARKDLWDKIHCIAPILSGLLIGGFGAFIGYSYNQQQIKLQEAETLERFIPHLAGNEKSKKAAILAMSSLTNTELAAKLASLFASEGTVSALESIAQAGNTKDRTVANEALAKAFGNMAQRSLDENHVEDAESYLRRAIAIRENLDGVNSVDLCDHLERLAELYMTQGKVAQAEPLLRRSLKLRELNGKPSTAEALKSFNRLSDLLEPSGSPTQTTAHQEESASDLPDFDSGKSNESASGESENSTKQTAVAAEKAKTGELPTAKSPTPESSSSAENTDSIKDKHPAQTLGSTPQIIR